MKVGVISTKPNYRATPLKNYNDVQGRCDAHFEFLCPKYSAAMCWDGYFFERNYANANQARTSQYNLAGKPMLITTTYQFRDFVLRLLQLVCLHCLIWAPSANAALIPHYRLQTSDPSSYILPLHHNCCLMPLAVSLELLLPFPSLTLSGFFIGMLEVYKTRKPNFYTYFRLIPLTLFVSRNLTLIYLLFSGSLDYLLCHLIALTPCLAFFLLMSRTLAAASSFSSGRVYLSWNFLPPLFLRLISAIITYRSTSL